MQNNEKYVPSGWQCPKCLRINSPNVNECPCVKENKKNYNEEVLYKDGRQILVE